MDRESGTEGPADEAGDGLPQFTAPEPAAEPAGDEVPPMAPPSSPPPLSSSAPPPSGSAPPLSEPTSTWGWTAPNAAAAWTPTTPTRDAGPGRSGLRSAFVGGLVGALVGALVAGGLVVAFDDDPDSVVQTRTAITRARDDAEPVSASIVPGDISSILDAVRPAVVRIDVGDTRSGAVEATGTGFIIDPTGVIVTNAHVVAGFDTVSVHLADGDELTGKVLGADDIDDLAVVKVSGTDLPTLELGDSDALKVGDPVIAIGNALDISDGSGATVTTGIVSGLDRVVRVENETLFDAIQTDAAINPGNSGGPLLDMNGRVIGINSAIASPDTSNNVGFAISISSAQPIIADLREGREPSIPFLGVSTETLTPNMAQDAGTEEGAVVIDVTNNTAASDAGIREGDVIVEIDGEPVTTFSEVAIAVRHHAPGDKVTIVAFRDGEKITLDVTLGERPNDS